MAGHSKFANIKHRKGAQDVKRAKLFTKIVREVITAVKEKGPDPSGNPRLRNAIALAKANNLPKDRIEGAIKKAESSGEGDNYEAIRYEGYGPCGIAIIVDALTDNRNRTASDVRSSFTKYGGSLGETGSVSFMFDHLGYIELEAKGLVFDKVFEAAIEAGASDVEESDDKIIIYTEVNDLFSVRDEVVKSLNVEPNDVRLDWKPKNITEIDNLEDAQKFLKFFDALEDSDDVQRITGNFKFSDKVIEELNK
jgi:YebC/PmpR family DNA-binding regulatory protein